MGYMAPSEPGMRFDAFFILPLGMTDFDELVGEMIKDWV